MNYLTNYYKNLSEQLQAKVNILSQKVRLLSEDAGDSASGDAIEDTDNPWIDPVWTPPEFNPDLPRSPVRPLNEFEWITNNPRPNENNYPLGPRDPAYQRDYQQWIEALLRAMQNYNSWFRYMRGLNRITGQGKDKEWKLPVFVQPDSPLD